jgi:hypothetical protein
MRWYSSALLSGDHSAATADHDIGTTPAWITRWQARLCASGALTIKRSFDFCVNSIGRD